MKKQKMWEEWEINFLKNNYTNLKMLEIRQQLSDRTYSSITNKAHLLGLDNRSINLSNVSNLLSGSNEAFYWLGFLLADGHFSKTNQIQINLSVKDLNHLKKFATFVEYKKELEIPSLFLSDINIIPKIAELYEIKNNKTYYPPNISKLSGDSLFSLVIGFIDGDGSINKRGNLYIKVHSSWLNIVDFMMTNIVEIGKHTIKINKDGLTICTLTNIEAIKKIKERAKKLNLPILTRKWDRVNKNKLSKREFKNKYEIECLQHFENGLKPKDVIEKTKVSYSFIIKIYAKYKESIKEKDIKRDIERTIN